MIYDLHVLVLGSPDLRRELEVNLPSYQFEVPEQGEPTLVVADLSKKAVLEEVRPWMQLPLHIRPKLVVVTDDSGPPPIAEMIRLGASAYLSLSAEPLVKVQAHIQALSLAQQLRTRWLYQSFRQKFGETFCGMVKPEPMEHIIAEALGCLACLYIDDGQNITYADSVESTVPDWICQLLHNLEAGERRQVPCPERDTGSQAGTLYCHDLVRHGRFHFRLAFMLNSGATELGKILSEAIHQYVPQDLFDAVQQLKLASASWNAACLETFTDASGALAQEITRLQAELANPDGPSRVEEQLNDLAAALDYRAQNCERIQDECARNTTADQGLAWPLPQFWEFHDVPRPGDTLVKEADGVPPIPTLRDAMREVFRLFHRLAESGEAQITVNEQHTPVDFVFLLSDSGPRASTLQRGCWFTPVAMESTAIQLFEYKLALKLGGWRPS